MLCELKPLEEVAYIRFASIYRHFQVIEDLRRELEELRAPLEDDNSGDGRLESVNAFSRGRAGTK